MARIIMGTRTVVFTFYRDGWVDVAISGRSGEVEVSYSGPVKIVLKYLRDWVLSLITW